MFQFAFDERGFCYNFFFCEAKQKNFGTVTNLKDSAAVQEIPQTLYNSAVECALKV